MSLEPLKPSYYYHFFNRGNNKENIFIEDENYLFFLQLMKKYLLSVTDVYSYCLLPNHFHFIIRIKEEKNLPDKYRNNAKKIYLPFSNLFNAYAKSFNAKYDRSGSLFQKSPKRILIKDENYLKNLIIYVNANPSIHNIQNYRKYKYSSYQSLISNKDTLLKRKEVIDLFDDVNNFKSVMNTYEKRIELLNEKDLEI